MRNMVTSNAEKNKVLCSIIIALKEFFEEASQCIDANRDTIKKELRGKPTMDP